MHGPKYPKTSVYGVGLELGYWTTTTKSGTVAAWIREKLQERDAQAAADGAQPMLALPAAPVPAIMDDWSKSEELTYT